MQILGLIIFFIAIGAWAIIEDKMVERNKKQKELEKSNDTGN